MKLASTLAGLCLGAILLASPARAEPTDPNAGIYAPIRQFMAAVNAADPGIARSAFVESPSMTDDIPRHYWSGPTAVDDWFSDAHLAAGQIVVNLWKPVFTDVTGDRAYASFPCNYTVMDKGKAQPASGMFVFALEKRGEDWKILSFAWAHTSGSTNPPAGVAVDPNLWTQEE